MPDEPQVIPQEEQKEADQHTKVVEKTTRDLIHELGIAISESGGLEKTDQEIFEEAMRMSLSNEKDEDGQSKSKAAIETLANHPIPEVVRRLVAINMFDSHYEETYDSKNRELIKRRWKDGDAMKVLLQFKESTNWVELVNQASEKYPELSLVKPELLELKIKEPDNYIESPRLAELEQAFMDKYLIALRLNMIDDPDDQMLAKLYSSKRVAIDRRDLLNLNILKPDEYIGLQNMPYDFNGFAASCYLKLGSPDKSPKEKKDTIERLKRIGKISKRLSEKNIYDNAYRISDKEFTLFQILVDSEEDLEKIFDFVDIYAEYKKLLYHSLENFTKIHDRFGDTDGYQIFVKVFAQVEPKHFLSFARKEDWKVVVGEEVLNKFLDALPKENDEKRNAFTHNDYDRTTNFIKFLRENNEHEFSITKKDLQIVTEYIKEFGFSKDPIIYRYFNYLVRFSSGEISKLPADIEESGIRTTGELKNVIERMKTMAYSEEPIIDLSNLTDFELANLRIVTGKARHRFNAGRPSMQEIVSDFQKDMREGKITPVPDGYKPVHVMLGDSEIVFDKSEAESDFRQLAQDIEKALASDSHIDLIADLQVIFDLKLAKLSEIDISKNADKKAFINKEVERFNEYKNAIASVESLDSLMKITASMKIDKNEQPAFKSILRRCIFRTLFAKNPGQKAYAQSLIDHGVAPESILGLVDMIKDPIREHVVNFQSDGEYWSKETLQAIKENKGNLKEIFEPYNTHLKKIIENFQEVEGKGTTDIFMIPDRGFIGEMSGYLADVCYTAEYPLLKDRDVVPYKFVTTDKDTGLPRFIGSVLIFEVNTEEGEEALLVRGFDVPNESDYDMDDFIEKFLDQMGEVAKERGKQKVLIPGNSGAISNYTRTLRHMGAQYITGKDHVSLGSRFAFNGYDLTNNCYVARDVQGYMARKVPKAA